MRENMMTKGMSSCYWRVKRSGVSVSSWFMTSTQHLLPLLLPLLYLPFNIACIFVTLEEKPHHFMASFSLYHSLFHTHTHTHTSLLVAISSERQLIGALEENVGGLDTSFATVCLPASWTGIFFCLFNQN